jgi:hypothetical protein
MPRQRPAFNVFEPFQGVTIVAMNGPMVSMLLDFIDDIEDLDNGIMMLAHSLDPEGYGVNPWSIQKASRRTPMWQRRGHKTIGFGVISKVLSDNRQIETSSEVSVLALDFRTSKRLQQLISSFDFDDIERELIAFSRALANPTESREIRDEKMRAREDRDDRDQDERENGQGSRGRVAHIR